MYSDVNTDTQLQPVELRTGTPYAKLISHQREFSNQVGNYFNIDAGRVIPTAGTTGAIEAVRNHILKLSLDRAPCLMTVSPGYWRAWDSFRSLGYRITEVSTQADGFTIDEQNFVTRAQAEKPDLIYLSLPNNPTGALFQPDVIIAGVPEKTAVLIDLTLPSCDFDSRKLLNRLLQQFEGRKNLFLAGSTSKSHGTAEYRIGWLVCANADDAHEVCFENRNVVSTVAIEEGIRKLKEAPSFRELIPCSFASLKEGEKEGRYEIIRPRRRTETGYVLIKPTVNIEILKETLEARRILVLWGSECGLTDTYIRLEMLEPANVEQFIKAIESCEAVRPSEAPKIKRLNIRSGRDTGEASWWRHRVS
jgi:aspartate/methionine/tyrosine aminotransferase